MLYQKHKKPSQATQKIARGMNFQENQRQEISSRPSLFAIVTSLGRGRNGRAFGWGCGSTSLGG